MPRATTPREETAELDKSEDLERRKLDNAKHTVVDDKHLHDNRCRTQDLNVSRCQERQRIKFADPDKRTALPHMTVFIKSQCPEWADI